MSHSAGFTHETPIGKNHELDVGDFDELVLGIPDTWPRSPVGSGSAYSNLGVDLAAYILERAYGKSFPALMQDMLLGPLGMTNSTFDEPRFAPLLTAPSEPEPKADGVQVPTDAECSVFGRRRQKSPNQLTGTKATWGQFEAAR